MKSLTSGLYFTFAIIGGLGLILSIPTYSLLGVVAAQSLMTFSALAIGALFVFSVLWLWRVGSQNNLLLLIVVFSVLGLASGITYFFFQLGDVLIGLYVALAGILGSIALKLTKKLSIHL